jgi:hypothetical protein
VATPIPPNRAAFTLDEIARETGGTIATPSAVTSVRGLSTDSRATEPDQAFVAIAREVRRLRRALLVGRARLRQGAVRAGERIRQKEALERLAAMPPASNFVN